MTTHEIHERLKARFGEDVGPLSEPKVDAFCVVKPERIVEVEWDAGVGTVFLMQIQVEAIDRSRLLSDVTRVLSDHHVNILSATVSTSRDRVAVSRFVFEMAETTHLNSVLAAVRKVDGVFDVYRITGARPDHEA